MYCLEWYAAEQGPEHWVRWQFRNAKAGRNFFIFQWHPFGRPARLTITDPTGRQLLQHEITAEGPDIFWLEIDLPADGDYAITLSGVGEGESGARVAKAAFLVPAAQADLLPRRRLR